MGGWRPVFLSTPSARRATTTTVQDGAITEISIHALREEGDAVQSRLQVQQRYFYPRPPRGGRPSRHQACHDTCEFLSTPSARRATYRHGAQESKGFDFYPRPPRGGRRRRTRRPARPRRISIHALREEGDAGVWCFRPPSWISIHALREEGDLRIVGESCVGVQFLSTPSARRATCQRAGRMSHDKFLSTPSARRATAKTETKSLFSNKLYNILHEFRRALIYNGSKNYPNHAK